MAIDGAAVPVDGVAVAFGAAAVAIGDVAGALGGTAGTRTGAAGTLAGPLDSLALSPRVVAVVLGMAAVTYATKAGGLWAMGRFDVPPRATAALEALPGSIVVAILAVELADGGPPEWAAAGLVVLVASWTDNVLLALAAGVAAVVLLRAA